MRFHSEPRRPNAPSHMAALIDLTRPALPFTAGDGQAFVRIPIHSSEGYFILPVRSPAFRDWFFAACFAQHDSIPSAHAFSLILHHLEAQANADPDCRRLAVYRRVGSRGAGLYPNQILLNLADPEGRFVEISPSGWQVTAGVNALLQTSQATLELPVPVAAEPPAAPLETLRSCLNLPSRADWLRCLAWLLAALRPTGPFPFLVLQGPPGSGKSFTARLLRSFIDPAAAPLTPVPHNTRHLHALARQHWVLAFDHISKLSPQLCDSLCRLSYGAGVSVRETPAADAARDPLVQSYRRPMLFTVTSRWSPPPEFASRALTVTLPEIAPDRRRPEAAILATVTAIYPQIVGALCTAVSTALRRIVEIAPAASPHCADALAWAMAAAPALGCTDSEMQQALLALPPSPFVQSIQSLLAAHSTWTGPATTLFELLPPSSLYESPKGLSQYLNNNAPTLAAAGITFRFVRRHGGGRALELRLQQGDTCCENRPQDASPGRRSRPQTKHKKDPIAA